MKKQIINIVYNHGTTPIFIVAKYRPHPYGLPGIPETTYCIGPGDGMDLTMINLSTKKPKVTKQKISKK